MSIRLGIYDIFSRIIPGGFYLGIFIEFARIVQLTDFDWSTLKDLGVVPSLGLSLIAFVIGSAMDRMGFAWHRLFGVSDRILAEFKNEHRGWKIEFHDEDWAILRAYVYLHNPNVADEIERHNALSIMMRNISFGLFLLAACEMIQLVKTNNWWFGLLVAILLFLSYQTGVQAKYMHDWFYRSIYETIIAYRLNLEERVNPVKISGKGKNAE